MGALNKISIKTRVMLLSILPTLVICALIISQLKNALEQKVALAQLSFAQQFAKQTGEVLRGVEEERDLTYGFLRGTPTGSDGRSYQGELNSQRLILDTKIREYREYLERNRNELKDLPELDEAANSLLNSSVNTVEARQFVDRYELKDAQGAWVVNRYGASARQALSAIDTVLQFANTDAELNALLSTYASLMKIQSIYSMERSTKIRTFTRPTLDYTSIGNNKAVWRQLQDANARFLAYAPQDIVEEFRSKHISSSVQQRVHGLRASLLDAGGEAPTLTPEEWFELSSDNIRTLAGVVALVEARISERMAEVTNAADGSVRTNVALAIVILSSVIILALMISRSITVPLHELVRTMVMVSESKDLAARIPVNGRDELAELGLTFNRLQKSLQDALAGVKNEVLELKEYIESVTTSMNQNQNRAEKQNLETDSVSVAVNEMSSTIQEVARNTQDAAHAAGSAHESSVISAENAKECMALMERLVTELTSTEVQVQNLNGETDVIGNILTVIQGIAEQTNLLALNAAIEAARAGEQGRGFAVVADEVRTLASKTKESTEQIRAQIEALQEGARSTTKSMSQLRDQGALAVNAVLSSVAAFDDIKDSLDRISNMTGQIATAAEEQTAVAEEINVRIHAVKNETEEMTTETHTVVAACEKLTKSSSKVDQYVAAFRV